MINLTSNPVMDPSGSLTPQFDEYSIRLYIGIAAFALPPLSYLLARTLLSSISASYYTDARNVFVGCLFSIGALLFCYRGHQDVFPPNQVRWFWSVVGGILNAVMNFFRVPHKECITYCRQHEEDWVANLGGVAAIAVALCPTACDSCQTNLLSVAHYIAAGVLFVVIVYFCLIAFMRRIAKKLEMKTEVNCLHFLSKFMKLPWSNNIVKRGWVYLICGFAILVVMAGLLIFQFAFPDMVISLRLTYYAEFAALWSFGIAWLVASQAAPKKIAVPAD